jgi:hypothetical protein
MTLSDFIDKIKHQSAKLSSKQEPLFSILEGNTIQRGLFLEFGVWNGHTINVVGKKLKHWSVYGFDSFEGLPEKWRDGFDTGFFSTNGKLPSVPKNVTLVRGWFDATIPQWKTQNSFGHIDILHIDCDLYSSTKTIFDNLKDMINTNTIIVFDELINYPTFENHEIKALYEFLEQTTYGVEVIHAGGYNGEKVAIKLI